MKTRSIISKMKIFLNYLFKNRLTIIYILAFSVFFNLIIIPIFSNVKFEIVSLDVNRVEKIIGLSSLYFIIFLYLYKNKYYFWCRYKNTYLLKNPPFILVDGILLILIFSVFINYFLKRDVFLNFLNNNSEHFIILFLFLLSIPISWQIKSLSLKKNIKNKPPHSQEDIYTLHDIPINDEKEDLLDRGPFVNVLYNEINNLPPSSSFVFALYGKWGEGKTSAINLLINKIKKDDNLAYLYFVPWYYNDNDSILKAFYYHINEAINETYIIPDLKRFFTKYIRLILSGIPNFNLNYLLKDNSISSIKNNLQNKINLINEKNILIIIDEIDRLSADECKFIFKLIRNNTNFNKIIYLLSFDIGIIEEGLEINKDFIEKIVQHKLILPPPDQKNIDEFCYYYINMFLKEYKIPRTEKEKFLSEYNKIYMMYIPSIINTLRKAKIYFNSVNVVFPLIKDEVNISDFFVLEVIRVFYNDIYNDIWANDWVYVPLKWSGKIEYLRDPFAITDNNGEKEKYIKGHLNNLLSEYNKYEKDILIGLLCNLFPEQINEIYSKSILRFKGSQEVQRKDKRINHPECFKKYFLLKVPKGEISDKFIQGKIAQINKRKNGQNRTFLKNIFIDLKKKGQLIEFLNKIVVLYYDDLSLNSIKKLIQTISEEINIFGDEEIDICIKITLTSNDIQNILIEIISNSSNLYFIVDIICYCKKENKGNFDKIYSSIDFNSIKASAKIKLKKHFLLDKNNIFKEYTSSYQWKRILYLWASNWKKDSTECKEEVNKYLFTNFEKNKDDLILFIRDIRVKNFEGEELRFNFSNIKVIINIDELKDIIVQILKEDIPKEKNDIELLDNYLTSYEEYTKKNNA